MHRSPVLAAIALLAALAPPAGAQAPTLAPLKACYVSAGSAASEREQIAVMAQGFTPNASATVAIDGTAVLAAGQIDPVGTIAGSVPAPFQAMGQRPFTLAITDNVNPGNAVVAQSLVTALDVRVTPAAARPSSRVRFRGRGFTGGPTVYAHYLRKGRPRSTVVLASTSGPCGTFDVRRRQLPIRHPHSGRWVLQIDHDPTWQAETRSVRVELMIDVTRRPRVRSVGSKVST